MKYTKPGIKRQLMKDEGLRMKDEENEEKRRKS
jgi:hypothetical protein